MGCCYGLAGNVRARLGLRWNWPAWPIRITVSVAKLHCTNFLAVQTALHAKPVQWTGWHQVQLDIFGLIIQLVRTIVHYLLTKGFGPQAIGTKICTRLSGLGTETISPPSSGLVRKLFLRHPRAWCGSYFPASLGLGTETISPPSSGLVRKLIPHEPGLISAFWLVLSLVDSLLVIEMISFSYIACLSLSLYSRDNHFCTIVNSISLFVLDWSQHYRLELSIRSSTCARTVYSTFWL